MTDREVAEKLAKWCVEFLWGTHPKRRPMMKIDDTFQVQRRVQDILRTKEKETVERCAKVATNLSPWRGIEIAKAIRQLGDK